jgi:hypothetical protein
MPAMLVDRRPIELSIQTNGHASADVLRTMDGLTPQRRAASDLLITSGFSLLSIPALPFTPRHLTTAAPRAFEPLTVLVNLTGEC